MKPSPTSRSLRALIDRALPTVDDLNTYVLDHFVSVYRQSAPGRSRQERLNLLLERYSAQLAEVLEALEVAYPEKVAQHRGVLQLEEQAPTAQPSAETPNHGAQYPHEERTRLPELPAVRAADTQGGWWPRWGPERSCWGRCLR